MNTIPVASDDSYQGIEGFGNVSLNVLFNDIDSDADNLVIKEFNAPSNGSVYSDENNNFFYKPNQGFSGVDDFTYTVNDFYPLNGQAKGGESTGNVQVNIRGNAPPNIQGES